MIIKILPDLKLGLQSTYIFLVLCTSRTLIAPPLDSTKLLKQLKALAAKHITKRPHRLGSRMRILDWAMGLGSQLVGWFVRPRNLGISLLSRSSAVLIVLAGGITIKAQGIAGFVEAFEIAPAEGLSGILLNILAYLACLTWVIGLVMVTGTQIREWREADTRRILVVEMRGLVDTSDKPLLTAIPRSRVGRRVDCLVDVRNYLASPTPNVKEALKEIEHIQRDVRRARGDTARADVQIVAGGMMQVPLLFYAGTLLDDEGNVLLMDWERAKGDWKLLNDPADGERFDVTGLESLDNSREVVLAVSASYLAAFDDIATTFPRLPVVHMARPNPQPNSLWSEETQAVLTQQFLQMLGSLANQGVEMVHLVLVAPASLAIRFGKAYDHRNMPKLRCYQREQGHTPPYPWSIQMPAATQPAVSVPTPIPTEPERPT
jgi:hypothetical protein